MRQRRTVKRKLGPKPNIEIVKGIDTPPSQEVTALRWQLAQANDEIKELRREVFELGFKLRDAQKQPQAADAPSLEMLTLRHEITTLRRQLAQARAHGSVANLQ